MMSESRGIRARELDSQRTLRAQEKPGTAGRLTSERNGSLDWAILTCSLRCVLGASALTLLRPDTRPGAVVLDHVVAVINGSVILQSDVNEEMGYAVLAAIQRR